jgi:hypothetical protein
VAYMCSVGTSLYLEIRQGFHTYSHTCTESAALEMPVLRTRPANSRCRARALSLRRRAANHVAKESHNSDCGAQLRPCTGPCCEPHRRLNRRLTVSSRWSLRCTVSGGRAICCAASHFVPPSLVPSTDSITSVRRVMPHAIAPRHFYLIKMSAHTTSAIGYRP